MSAGTIDIPFALGVEVWRVAGSAHTQTTRLCYECGGTCVVTLRLFDGTEHVLDCAGCSVGCDPPRGRIMEREIRFAPVRFTPESIYEIRAADVIYFLSGPGGDLVYARDMFASFDEYLAACEARTADARLERERVLLGQKNESRRKKAWDVHYYRAQIRETCAKLAALEARLARLAVGR